MEYKLVESYIDDGFWISIPDNAICITLSHTTFDERWDYRIAYLLPKNKSTASNPTNQTE